MVQCSHFIAGNLCDSNLRNFITDKYNDVDWKWPLLHEHAVVNDVCKFIS